MCFVLCRTSSKAFCLQWLRLFLFHLPLYLVAFSLNNPPDFLPISQKDLRLTKQFYAWIVMPKTHLCLINYQKLLLKLL